MNLARIQAILHAPQLDRRAALEALKACTKFESEAETSSRADSPFTQTSAAEPRKLFASLLDRFTPNAKELGELYTSHPPPTTSSAILSLEKFSKSPASVLPEAIAMVPFRRAAYSGDFDNALRIMDLTAGSKSNYPQVAGRKLMGLASYWAAGVGVTLVAVDRVLASGILGYWENRGMVVSMVATYLVAVSVYAAMARLGSKSAGDVLQFAKGTLTTTRFKRERELKMASLLAEMNRQMPENLGQCAPKMLTELAKRDFEVVESDDELLLKEFWARGGEGFEWKEPDQDPAWLIWREKMERTKQKRIGSPYIRTDSPRQLEWAQQVIPHASLLDVSKLSVEERIAMLDKDVKALADEGPKPLPNS